MNRPSIKTTSPFNFEGAVPMPTISDTIDPMVQAILTKVVQLVKKELAKAKQTQEIRDSLICAMTVILHPL
jgi:hypothetical protein